VTLKIANMIMSPSLEEMRDDNFKKI